MVLYARDIVETDFIALPANTNVLDGARVMKDSKHGFVVVGDPQHPEGIVTEWDVLAKVVADGRDPTHVTLGELMSKELLAVDADEGLSTVSQVMTEKGVRRLLVKKDGVILGVITAKTMLARMNEYVDKVSSQISRLQTPWF